MPHMYYHGIVISTWARLANTFHIQAVPGGKVNILGGHSIGHSKQKRVNVQVPFSEWFPR
jgi:hypothetical protein